MPLILIRHKNTIHKYYKYFHHSLLQIMRFCHETCIRHQQWFKYWWKVIHWCWWTENASRMHALTGGTLSLFSCWCSPPCYLVTLRNKMDTAPHSKMMFRRKVLMKNLYLSLKSIFESFDLGCKVRLISKDIHCFLERLSKNYVSSKLQKHKWQQQLDE